MSDMKLKLEIFGSLCAASKFEINGIAADSDDFGEQGDHDHANAEDYGCGDMRFERKASTAEVLDRY